MNRWYISPPALHQGEYSKCEISCARLYDGSDKTDYKHGRLELTNLRLLYKSSKFLALSLDLVSHILDESAGFLSSAKIVVNLTEPPANYQSFTRSSESYIKMSVKETDVGIFMKNFYEALNDRDWESSRFMHLSLGKPNTIKSSGGKPVRAGILGIERAMDAKQQKTNASISMAFEDMKQLMTQAKQMVSLSHAIAAKIKEQGNDVNSDDTSHFRSCLLSLGIDDPITRDAVGSSSEYHRKLAREICTALEPSVREIGGVMLLSEVYCRINRARGLQLLSPEDVANACDLMTKLELSLRINTFESGVRVLQLSSLDTLTLVNETKKILQEHCGGRDAESWRGMSSGELARRAALPLMLAKERLMLCERHGEALRDESSEGLYFYPNYFDVLSEA